MFNVKILVRRIQSALYTPISLRMYCNFLAGSQKNENAGIETKKEQIECFYCLVKDETAIKDAS